MIEPSDRELLINYRLEQAKETIELNKKPEPLTKISNFIS